jgi:crotonobetainyl-CoA:carnitine CoA-transferase CaiB-like acyl-CoA transferase
LEKTTDEWLAVLDAAAVPAGPVNNVADLLDDPQVLANELVVEYQHPVAGSVSMVGPIIQMEKTPTTVRRAPPTLGQHNEEILEEFGYSASEIEKLRETGAVAH